MKRGRSTSKPTREEEERIIASKEGPCMACLIRAGLGLMSRDRIVYGCDYNHAKSGNIRRGHMDGYALCIWHHRMHPMEGATTKQTRTIYGPSLMDGSALFHFEYGSDDFLIKLQTDTLSTQE